MKSLLLSLFLIVTTLSSHAKIWRINNTVAVNASFTSFEAAVNSSSVVDGDTLYIEPSSIDYSTGSITLAKRLVVLGVGYFLDPASANFPANTGLQATTLKSALSFIRIGDGANGSKFAGISFIGGLNFIGSATPLNTVFERNFFTSTVSFESGNNQNVIFRKNFFNEAAIISSGSSTTSNFTCENNIFFSSFSYVNLTGLTGSSNIIRNNSFYGVNAVSTIVNAYVANNIFGASSETTFTNCTIKNNIFQANQTLPGTASGNQVNISLTDIFAGGTTNSLDARVVLKAGSPAIAAGLTVGGVITPDCGAYGATDPYKLSGIPNIPTIYSMTVPSSIPSGSATMNISFSTRNNN